MKKSASKNSTTISWWIRRRAWGSAWPRREGAQRTPRQQMPGRGRHVVIPRLSLQRLRSTDQCRRNSRPFWLVARTATAWNWTGSQTWRHIRGGESWISRGKGYQIISRKSPRQRGDCR